MEHGETLARLAGETRAMGFMVAALIAAHPAPRQLREQFEQSLHEWTDQLASDPSTRTAPAFHEALQGKLRTYSELLSLLAPPAEDAR